jgi:tetratricopeptide (TPR) repeat protein
MRRLLIPLLLLSSAMAQTGNPSADSYVKSGVQAFKSGHYEDAASLFRKALAIDPAEKTHLYLGVTYSMQVVPNLDTPDNLRFAQQALEQFDAVLKIAPKSLIAIKQESYLYRNTRRPNEAKELAKSAQKLDPDDPELPYTIGVLDWTEAYKNANNALHSEGLNDRANGNPEKSATVWATIYQLNTPLVSEALAELTRAVEINPNYEDAMTYLSLTYRRRADLHRNDPSAIKSDLELADTWAKRAMEARKANEMAREAGVTNPQATPADPLLQAPATPPPPPPVRVR